MQYTARPIDKTLAKITVLAAPIVVLLIMLLNDTVIAVITVFLAYALTLCSCFYRLSERFLKRNPVSDFIHREQGQIRASSLSGLFEFHSQWQSIPLGDIARIWVADHHVEIHTHDEPHILSVVGSEQELLTYMQSLVADTQIDVTAKPLGE